MKYAVFKRDERTFELECAARTFGENVMNQRSKITWVKK